MGNADMNTEVCNTFPTPIEARFIRIQPVGWNNHTSLRFEILKCKGTCSGNWTYYDDACYYVNTTLMLFDEAVSMCESMGTILTSIHTQAENDFVQSMKIGIEAWIGLHDRTQEGVFEWLDETQTSYFRWSTYQPNNANGGQDCVNMLYTGGWADQPCATFESGAICKKIADQTIY
ncbi:low affinity immunoglobulin epsilon Fc receptor-like [Amphiura filiformis]|uniref:low affinity immunoglobulin epsilon Fc receptor-like n=1 Tax=Amphiura filiformis TaxID=82378 RepID=UPI003B21C9C4